MTEQALNHWTPALGVAMINRHLDTLGFTPRDSDGSDYQRGEDNTLRFKTGAAMGEITTQVVIDNQHQTPIRATSWGSTDKMMLTISGLVDRHDSMPEARR